MCGIFGIIGKQDRELLKKMDNVLIHRGPDSSGAINFEDVSIGVRRLSIIDLNTGDQPIHNEDGRLWVVQNGEIYNYLDLRIDLISKGHRFYTNSDTEVIIHAYEEYGEACVQRFNGMFAFVIWDTKRKRLFGARDRVGIKPFYFLCKEETLLFASEIKAILQDKSFRRELDMTSFYNYLSRLFVPGNRTIYKNIRKLPPGHTITFEKGKIAIDQYWDLNLKRKIFCEDAEYESNIRNKLENSVKRQLISDVPLGALLSGGVDSGSIVAFMAKNSVAPVLTFTVGYAGTDASLPNEIFYARESSNFFGTDHKEIIADSAVLIDQLPKIVWFFDEPFAGSLSQYQISQLTRKYVKVVLCGLGADELFGDYGRGVRLSQYSHWLSHIFLYAPRLVKKAILDFKCMIPQTGKQAEFFNGFNRYIIKLLELGKLYASQWEIFSERTQKELVKDFVLEQVDIKASIEGLFFEYLLKTKIKTIEDIVMYSNFKTQLVDEYLRYTDTLSMAHSLESRVPFLDNELIEYAATIPIRKMVRGRADKYLLKNALRPVLPSGVDERRKGFFSLPYGLWLRNELKNLALNMLSKERIDAMGYFSYKKVWEIVQSQYAGDDSKTYQTWSLLMFSLWHKLFIEEEVTSISQAEDCYMRDVPTHLYKNAS
ncbi:MAG: asparagine synthase (glutamine-hydrolyzing) [Nitrospirae bacterium RBG_13_41_22]|nr:MAG: asparagine synthase (glutamine-hydrolyzing) [Nitrospirae bacterium RBG_13_41_22]